jgi:hypothetical protein
MSGQMGQQMAPMSGQMGQQMAPSSPPGQPLPDSAATPPSASASGHAPPLLSRLMSSRLAQNFLALPPPRRLLILRASAAGFGALVLVLLLVLLWPRKLPIIVRSDPDQAEVFRDGESLGSTPIVLELKKGVGVTLTLRKEGYEDTTQDVEGGGEKVVLVTLEEKGSAGSPKRTPPKKSPNGNGDKPETAAEDEGSDEGSDDGKDDGKGDGVKKKKKKKKKKSIIF